MGQGSSKPSPTRRLLFSEYFVPSACSRRTSEYQLSDKMQDQARFGVVNRYSEEQIRDVVFKEAQDLDVPIKKEQIKVLVNPSLVRISLDYTVPIDLLVYKMDLHFTPSSENKSLL